MAPKKGKIMFTVLLASLLSASFAGGHRKLINKSTTEKEEIIKELPRALSDNEEAFAVRSRILVVKTNDYGRYNPTPTFSKPRFKLIPN